MTYTPLIVIMLLLVFGAAATLTVLFRAERTGHFNNLKAGAYVIFDENEPVGKPQDQLLQPSSGPMPPEESSRHDPANTNPSRVSSKPGSSTSAQPESP